MQRLFLGLLAIGAIAGGPAVAAEPDQATDLAAIRKFGEDYVQTFNQHDAKALADFWSPDAVYLNRLTREQVTGREAIAAEFVGIFKEKPELKIEVSSSSIDFVSPNVAVEQGKATYTGTKEKADPMDFSAVYVRRDGKWLLDRVTDKPKQTPPSHYEHLKELEWMIGSWVDDDQEDNATVTTDCTWNKNRNFLTRMYSVSVDGEETMAGVQIIGWDAATKSIRSWAFDSDGGVTEATWTHKGDKWYVRNKGVLADGRKASAVNIIKKVDDNSFTWQTIDRTAGGEILPDVDEIQIVRK